MNLSQTPEPVWRSREGFPEFVPRQGDSWLLLVPHDDDAVIGAALALQSGLRSGAAVTVAVVTDGAQGYCDLRERESIVTVREEETRRALELLGAPALRFLGFPDGDLFTRRPELQKSFTRLLREIRPGCLFICAGSDLHPDHRIVHEDMLISLFHASGAIWPELGEPLDTIPELIEFPVYCALRGGPHFRVEAPGGFFENKLEAIACYRSQRQIASLVRSVREAGPREYFRRHAFELYDPRACDALFPGDA